MPSAPSSTAFCGVVRGVRVGADLEGADLVAPAEEGLELLGLLGLLEGEGGGEDLAGSPIERHLVALPEDLAADLDRLGLVVYVEAVAADDATLAPAAGDDRRVGGLAAGRGEDALRGEHSADVFGARLAADEDDLDSLLGLFLRIRGVEAELAGGGAGDGVDARRDLELLELGRADCRHVDDRVEHALDLLGGDARDRLGLGDEALAHHVDRDLEGG